MAQLMDGWMRERWIVRSLDGWVNDGKGHLMDGSFCGSDGSEENGLMDGLSDRSSMIKVDQKMTQLFQGGEQKPYRDEHSAPFGWKTRSQTNLAFDVYNSRLVQQCHFQAKTKTEGKKDKDKQR